MDPKGWTGLATELQRALRLEAPPLAITFTDTLPDDIEAFSEPMPTPTEDGRTGRVPAGCVFWMHGAERTFSTQPSDHGNCSVGSMTHGLITMEEAATKADVAALLESGWVTEEMVPLIPTVSRRAGAIVYGPLAETSIDPDVVLLRVDPRQMMVLSDALPGIAIEGKPQCHIIAMAKEHGQIAASVGCQLSRVRTAMPAHEMTCAIPASRLGEVVERVVETSKIDAVVASYAGNDSRRFKMTV